MPSGVLIGGPHRFSYRGRGKSWLETLYYIGVIGLTLTGRKEPHLFHLTNNPFWCSITSTR